MENEKQSLKVEAERELVTKFICMTKHIGIKNNLFGGEMLSQIDIAGAIFASEKIKSPSLVTKTISNVDFKNAVKVGHIVYFYGEVIKKGVTSISIRITAVRHNVVTGKDKEVCAVDMVFVKVDEEGEACPI
jgi:acyl-CoA thioesterase YciA